MIRHLVVAVLTVAVCILPTVVVWVYAASSSVFCPLP